MAVSLEYCQSLPKAELHAHLNGSISGETMRVLIDRKSKKFIAEGQAEMIPEIWKTVMKTKGQTLDNAFEIFPVIHSIVDCEEAIVMATCDVVKDFSDDGVKYLELRTTPRSNSESGMTKRTYIDAVLRGIELALPLCCDDMSIRLLLSIDRRQNTIEAYDTLKLAQEYRFGGQGRVTGIDLSGEPTAGSICDIVSVLEEAKHMGFKLSLHIAERPNLDDESSKLLMLIPDRLGHATFLHHGLKSSTTSNVQTVLEKRIPIEICMTSNVKAGTVASYDQHHLKFWMEKKHPFALCTDDKGVFMTTLSDEYYIAAKTFGLNKEDLWQISSKAMEYTFD